MAGVRTIELDHKDLDSVAATKEEMKKQMLFRSSSGKVENPISVAIDFEKLRKSDDPEKRQIADILQSLAELRRLIELRCNCEGGVAESWMPGHARQERVDHAQAQGGFMLMC